jgi:hypothetical protein
MTNIFVLNQLYFQNEFDENNSFNELENIFERFSKFHKFISENCLSIFNEFIPIPNNIDNPYNWCKKNWGTLWDAFDIKVNIINYSVTFTTSRYTPDEFFKTFSKMYPEYKIINTVKIIEKNESDEYKRDLELYTQFIYNGNIRNIHFNNLKLQ